MHASGMEMAVRLSPDRLRLEIFLPEDLRVERCDLAGEVRRRAAAVHISLPQSDAALETALRSYPRGCWQTLYAGEPPTPPIDGSVELVVPIPVGRAQRPPQGRRLAVRAGTILARRHPGVPGRPGRDLLGQVLPTRAPREASLPQGAQTMPSADGSLLIACCDGEAVLRQLAITILPLQVHHGDLAAGTILSAQGPLFITGSVLEHARVEAEGEIVVQGTVQGAQVWSNGGALTVLGEVTGSSQHPAVLQASGEIRCGPLTDAHVIAGGDIRLRAPAKRCTFRAAGGVYVPDTLAASLEDVRLQVDGGLFPPRTTFDRAVRRAASRQHVRVATRIQALVAVQGAPPLQYRWCSLLNLSVGGARCELIGRELALLPGMVVQLKILLPDGEDQLLVLARVARGIAPRIVGLSFLQMTLRDRDRLMTFCLRLLLQRGPITYFPLKSEPFMPIASSS